MKLKIGDHVRVSALGRIVEVYTNSEGSHYDVDLDQRDFDDDTRSEMPFDADEVRLAGIDTMPFEAYEHKARKEQQAIIADLLDGICTHGPDGLLVRVEMLSAILRRAVIM